MYSLKNKTFSKAISFVLAFCLIVTYALSMPFAAFADEIDGSDTVAAAAENADGELSQSEVDGDFEVMDGSAAADEYDWASTTWAGGLDFSWYDENDVKSEYHITTPAQWQALAWICSEDLAQLADFDTNTASNIKAVKGTVPTTQNKFEGIKIYLDNDIDMGGVYDAESNTWSGPNYYPIGSQAANDLETGRFYNSFYGSFDGQGHIVKNVYCKRTNASVGNKGSQSIGLFGRIGAEDDAAPYPDVNITIENVAVTGYIAGYRSTGGVVGKTLHVAAGKQIVVQNCLNFAEVVTNNGSKGTGGIVGTLWNGAAVLNCANFGKVTAAYRSANVAGVSGSAEGPTTNSYNVGTVTNTVNAANSGAVALNQSTANVTNCYALEGSCPGFTDSIVNGKTFVSGGWKSEAEMKSAAFVNALNGEDGDNWTMAAESDAIYGIMQAAGVAGYPVPAAFISSEEPAVWDGKTVDTSWYNASADVYEISAVEQLAGLAAIVNGTAEGIEKTDFAGKTVKLMNDITIDKAGKYTAAEGVFGSANYGMKATWYKANDNAVIWTPIGTGTATAANAVATANYFAGTFDGQNHAVNGVYTDGAASVQGLFGCVSGTVKNLTVGSGLVAAKQIAGGVAACVNNGTIENCTNKALVYADGGQAADSNSENGLSRSGSVGGIAGLVAGNVTVSGCQNDADITCTNTAKGGRVGGIIGLNDTGKGFVTKCINNGKVDGYQYAGGIIGANFSADFVIDQCGNNGKTIGHSSGSTYVGGVTSYTKGNIANCFNTADVAVYIDGKTGTKAAHFGGIVSDFAGEQIINCYNTGSLLTYDGYTRSGYGSICASGYDKGGVARLINCYGLDTVAGEDITNSGLVIQKTADEMKTAEFLNALNGNGRAFIFNNDGTPVLRFMTADDSTLVGVTVSAQPKLEYGEGETFDTSDLVIKANYSDNTSVVVKDYTVSNIEPLKLTDKQVTVTATYEGRQYQFVFDITVASGYIVSAVPDTQYAAKGSTFTVGLVVNSTANSVFAGVEAVMNYDTSVLEYVSADSQNVNATAGKVKFGKYGDNQEVGDGCKVLAVTFKALDNIPAGQTEALFSVSDAMVTPQGQPTGIAARCGADGVVTLTNYPVTLPAGAKDVAGVDANGQYVFGQDITFKLLDLADGNLVIAKIGDGAGNILIAQDDVYTIPASEIDGAVEVTVEETSGSVSFIEFDAYKAAPTGYKLVKFVPANQDAAVQYQYNGSEMFKTTKGAYSQDGSCYVFFVTADTTELQALKAITVAEGTNTVLSYDGDVNGNGNVMIDDAQLVYDLSTNWSGYLADTAFTTVSMFNRLEADVNGDGVVDVTDARVIVNIILGVLS